MALAARFREIFRSAFRDLSFWKRWLLRISLTLLLVGGGLSAYAAVRGGSESLQESWSFSALASGAGCILGFLIGAAVRVFLKLALLAGVAVAGGLYALSALGWLDLPWASFSEISGAVSQYIHDQGSSLQHLLTSWLPSSGMTGLGLFSGLTQRPDTDPGDR